MTRTRVKAHYRKHGLLGSVRVKSHMREVGTKNAARRREARRPKRERAIDEALRAEGTRPWSNKRNRKQWKKDPGSTDISGIDS